MFISKIIQKIEFYFETDANFRSFLYVLYEQTTNSDKLDFFKRNFSYLDLNLEKAIDPKYGACFWETNMSSAICLNYFISSCLGWVKFPDHVNPVDRPFFDSGAKFNHNGLFPFFYSKRKDLKEFFKTSKTYSGFLEFIKSNGIFDELFS